MKKFSVKDLSICYSDDNESLRKINIEIEANAITVLFGPAGGGKSTFLRVLNRLNDLADVKTMTGKVLFNGTNILDPKLDVIELRRKIGMVFSRPVPLPLTIYENVAYGLIMAGERNKKKLDQAVESALRQAVLWDEVYDRLSDSGFATELKEKYTIILAPHNVQQAARMADYAAFFLMGELVEYSGGKDMFLTPKDKRTQDYITGRFG